jgi:hypothetical protein
MRKNRGAYHRRVTEVKTHAAKERRDLCQYSDSSTLNKKWVSLKGQQIPADKIPKTEKAQILESAISAIQTAQALRKAKLTGVIKCSLADQIRTAVDWGISQGLIQRPQAKPSWIQITFAFFSRIKTKEPEPKPRIKRKRMEITRYYQACIPGVYEQEGQ